MYSFERYSVPIETEILAVDSIVISASSAMYLPGKHHAPKAEIAQHGAFLDFCVQCQVRFGQLFRCPPIPSFRQDLT